MLLEFKPEYGYVIGAATLGYFVHHFYMGFAVGAARKKYKINYPAMYADKDNCPNEKDAKAFNCVQRGHQNSLENLPSYYALLMLSGLRHPVTAACAGLSYCIGRIIYFQGYSTGNPDKRINGAIFMYPGIFTMAGICIKVAIEAFKGAK